MLLTILFILTYGMPKLNDNDVTYNNYNYTYIRINQTIYECEPVNSSTLLTQDQNTTDVKIYDLEDFNNDNNYIYFIVLCIVSVLSHLVHGLLGRTLCKDKKIQVIP